MNNLFVVVGNRHHFTCNGIWQSYNHFRFITLYNHLLSIILGLPLYCTTLWNLSLMKNEWSSCRNNIFRDLDGLLAKAVFDDWVKLVKTFVYRVFSDCSNIFLFVYHILKICVEKEDYMKRLNSFFIRH